MMTQITPDGAEHPIPLPAAEEVLVAYALGDHEEVVRAIDRSPLEVWYGVRPDRLIGVIDALPRSMTSTSVTLRAFRLFLQGGADTSPRPPAGTDARALGEFAANVFGHRLQGRPMSSVRAETSSPELLETANVLFDTTGGWRTFTSVQAGLSRMLAGDLAGALTSFGAAKAVPPPQALTVLLRDAHAKSALVHALFGSPEAARRDLDVAAALPRTQSWAEAIVSAHAEIAAAVLADHDHAAEAAERIERLPAAIVGEVWPFWLEAIFRLHLRAGRPEAGLRRVEDLSESTAAATATEGYPGNNLALIRAAAAMSMGDSAHARHLLALADRRLIGTQQLRAVLSILDGDIDGAVGTLIALHAQTSALVQSETTRRMLLTWATLRRGDRDSAAAQLSELARSGEEDVRDLLPFWPAELAALAAEAVPDWPQRPVTVVHRTDPNPRLTPRELEVLTLMASLSSREKIAEELFVSENTVKSQQRSIYRKLGVSSRTDALLEAHRRGLL